MATLIAWLEIEFGRGAGEGLAQHFLAAEDADFRWDVRIKERWLGAYESEDAEDFWLDRVAICGRLDRKWFAATMIVDGDGNVVNSAVGRRRRRRWQRRIDRRIQRRGMVRTASCPGFLLPRRPYDVGG